MMSSQRSSAFKGFTLIEILIAIALLGLGLHFLINALTMGMKGIRGSQDKVRAVNLAQEVMETYIMRKPFSHANLNIATTNLSAVGGLSRSYTVAYVNSSDLNTTVAGPTNYKRVTVTVSDSFNQFSPVNLVTIRTNYTSQ